MNIAVDIRSLMSEQRTGVGGYTYHLLENLFKLETDHRFFLFYNSYHNVDIPSWSYENVEIISFNYPNKLLNLSVLLFGKPHLDKLITSKADIDNLDVFFAPNLNFTPLSEDVQFILTIHDLSFKYFPEFLTTKRKLGYKARRPEHQLRQADIILTPSENTKRDVNRNFNVQQQKIKKIYPAIDESEQQVTQRKVKEKYSLPSKFILFLGSLEPRKNVEGLLEGYSEADIDQEYKLVIAGASGWKNQKTKEKIEDIDNVEYIGYIKETEKPALLGLADLFVYSSFYEGFGFPVLEAMAGSTPVITSERSSLPEVCEAAAYLVDPRIKSEISKGMELILNNQQIYDSYVEAGTKQVEKFDWKRSAQKFLEVCSQVV